MKVQFFAVLFLSLLGSRALVADSVSLSNESQEEEVDEDDGNSFFKNMTRGSRETSTDEENAAITTDLASLTWAYVSEKIFLNRCVFCHASGGKMAGIDPTSYENVIKNLHRIKMAVIDLRYMPRGDRLPEEKIQLLDAWIAAGAPKEYKPKTPKEKQQQQESID